MKKSFFILLVLFLCPLVLSSVTPKIIKKHAPQKAHPNLDLCPLCLEVMDQTIQELLNIILNIGIIGSCGELCHYLEPKFGKIVETACDIICDYIGIEGFIWLIQKADLDPIFFCQELRACPIHDCELPTCAEFVKDPVIEPNPCRDGDEVEFTYEFTVYAQTGTGMIYLDILTSEGSQPDELGGGEIVEKGFEVGTFDMTFDATLASDPTQDPPVIFKPGLYKSTCFLCEGQCGSKHKHTRLLASVEASFNMTSN